jgi:prepilin peptidase CpaA
MRDVAWSACFVAALLAVFISDTLYRRISNPLVASILSTGICYWVSREGARGLGFALAGCGVGAACLLWMYVMGWVGAADVKVFAAFGSLLGPDDAAWAAVYGFIVGGMMGLPVLWRRRRQPWVRGVQALAHARASGTTVPLGAALAVGVLAVAAKWVP